MALPDMLSLSQVWVLFRLMALLFRLKVALRDSEKGEITGIGVFIEVFTNPFFSNLFPLNKLVVSYILWTRKFLFEETNGCVAGTLERVGSSLSVYEINPFINQY